MGKAFELALHHEVAGAKLIGLPETLAKVGPTLEAYPRDGLTHRDAGPQQLGGSFQAVVAQRLMGRQSRQGFYFADQDRPMRPPAGSSDRPECV
ncbi:hypothetical protein [Spirosoma soli]